MTLKILYAEDDDDIRELVVMGIKRRGYEVRAVENGLRLIEALEEDEYDLILTDNDMPELRGISALHRIRQDARFAQLPVIVLTANSDLREQVEKDSGTFLDKSGPTSALWDELAKHAQT